MHNTRIAAGIMVTLTLLGATASAVAALSPSKVKKMRAEAPEALTVEILSVTIGEKDGEQQHVVYTAKVTDVHRSAATLKPGDEIRILAYIRNPTDEGNPEPGPRFPNLLSKGWIGDAYLRPVAESKDLELAVYGHSFVQKKPKTNGQNEEQSQTAVPTRYVGRMLPIHKKLKLLAKHRVIARFDGIKTSPFEVRGFRATYAEFVITEYLHYRKVGEYGDDKWENYHWVMNSLLNEEGDDEIRALIDGLKPGDQVLIEWKHLYGQVSKGKDAPMRPLMLMQKVSADEIAELKRLDPPVWVHEMIDRFEAGPEKTQSIVRYTYRGEPVFAVVDGSPPAKLFDAAGKPISIREPDPAESNVAFLTDPKLIWQRPVAQ